MHKYIKRIFSCIMTVFITIVMLNMTSDIMERKESVIKNGDFIKEKQNVDVLFLGTSHVINGVYPMELWNEYGIVSYNLAGHDTPMASSYWVLQNALDYTMPKVVVIDCMGIRNPVKVSNHFDYTHVCFDAFPLSFTKVRAVNDLLAGNEEHSKWDLLFPLSQYHNRWNQLTDDDFNVEYNSEKGAEMRVDLVTPLSFETIPAEQKVLDNTVSIEYLERIIVECEAAGIEVLLTYLPFPAEAYYQEEANRCYDIAEAYGVDYINFLEIDIVDYQTDCYDEASHLNPSGARKVTSYIGQYIMDNYAVSDQRQNTDYEDWMSDYEEYQVKKNSILTDIENPYVYMAMLTDHNYNVIIEVTNNEILLDAKLCVLFENLGIDCSNLENVKYIVLDNNKGIVDYITEEQMAQEGIQTSFGLFSKTWYSDTSYELAVDGKVYYDVLVEDDQWHDMRTMVIDNRTQQLVESLYYMHLEDENIEWNTILCRVN